MLVADDAEAHVVMLASTCRVGASDDPPHFSSGMHQIGKRVAGVARLPLHLKVLIGPTSANSSRSCGSAMSHGKLPTVR
jgi:hypothetical protein